MKLSFDKCNALEMKLLTPDDWPSYMEYYQNLNDPHHYAELLANKDLSQNGVRDWFINTLFSEPNSFIWGLFDGETMIGQTALFIYKDDDPPFAFLAGSEITDEYRGNRLVDLFYDIRMRCLTETGFKGDILMTIRPTNTTSQKVAARNKFENSGQLDDNGYQVWRPQAPQ